MSHLFHAWRAKHFVQVSAYSWRPKSGAAEKRIRDEFARFAVSIKLEDGAKGIPQPLYSEHWFEWDATHFQRILTFSATGSVALPDGTVRQAGSAGAFLAILRQLSSGLVYAGETHSSAFMLSDSRMDALETVIDCSQGPVLVAVFYKAEVAALLQRLSGRARAFVGGTPARERSQLIEDWNCDRLPVLIAAPGAMGHGINLQHGSSRTIVWFTHSFDWAQRAQFNARLVRSGQTKVVSIINLVGDAGIDRAVLSALAAKRVGEQAILAALDIGRHLNLPEPSHVSA